MFSSLINFCKKIISLTNNLKHELNYDGYKIVLKGEYNSRFVINKLEKKFFSNLDLNGKNIYDIGAYVGILSIYFAKRIGADGMLVSIEPNKFNNMKLKENVKLNNIKNIKILKIAVGERRERGRLLVPYFSYGRSKLYNKLYTKKIYNNLYYLVNVNIDSLDNIKDKYNLPNPDFIKIDIEGAEYRALLGMKIVLEYFKPSIYIEIHQSEQDSDNEHIKEIVNYLSSFGYSIYHLESDKYIDNRNYSIASKGHIYCSIF